MSHPEWASSASKPQDHPSMKTDDLRQRLKQYNDAIEEAMRHATAVEENHDTRSSTSLPRSGVSSSPSCGPEGSPSPTIRRRLFPPRERVSPTVRSWSSPSAVDPFAQPSPVMPQFEAEGGDDDFETTETSTRTSEGQSSDNAAPDDTNISVSEVAEEAGTDEQFMSNRQLQQGVSRYLEILRPVQGMTLPFFCRPSTIKPQLTADRETRQRLISHDALLHSREAELELQLGEAEQKEVEILRNLADTLSRSVDVEMSKFSRQRQLELELSDKRHIFKSKEDAIARQRNACEQLERAMKLREAQIESRTRGISRYEAAVEQRAKELKDIEKQVHEKRRAHSERDQRVEKWMRVLRSKESAIDAANKDLKDTERHLLERRELVSSARRFGASSIALKQTRSLVVIGAEELMKDDSESEPEETLDE